MTPSSFQSALNAELEATREAERQRFGDELLAWLVVAPGWTEACAKECQFPADLRVIGPELERSGMLQRAVRLTSAGEEDTHWWMPSTVRRETIARMRRQDAGRNLVQVSTVAATAVLERRASLPASLVRWAELARDPLSADRTLRATVTHLVADGNTGEALAWVESARIAAEVLGGALETGTVLAERQIELAYRKEHDQKLLEKYLERGEQSGWVRALLDAPDERWALHLLGMGGVGKTMLIRHTMSRIASERGLVAVKIDFDHLSPDYPVRRPGQLLAALGEELSFHARDHSTVRYFNRLAEWLTSLDEKLSAELPPLDPLANVRRPELDPLLDVLADALRRFPAPVLLVLDTCEELAKLRVRGATPGEVVQPAVTATFEILERLHQRVPSVRVLFAGRRFLASKGAGWEMAGEEAEAGSVLPPRLYLALEELRGFDRAEATALFVERFRVPLDSARQHAVLAHSPELSGTRVRRSDRSLGAETERYHPFDVALYANWLAEQPDLDLHQLQSEGDPYVERRILGRITDPLLARAMPALVLMHRFDPAMVAAALGLDGDERTELLRLVRDQEWTEVQPDDESDALFYEIQRSLWPRLVRFYATGAERSVRDAAMRRIGPGLSALVRETPAAKLRPEYVNAALRALDPRAGGALWSEVECALLRAGARERLSAISDRLLAEGGAAEEQKPLWPHVLATYAGLKAHSAPGSLSTYWLAIEQALPRLPDPDAAAWLAARALCARIASYHDNPREIPDEWVMELIDRANSDLARDEAWPSELLAAWREAIQLAALAAAVDVLLVAARLDRELGHSRYLAPAAALRVLETAADTLATRGAPRDLRALFRTLAARRAAVTSRWNEAERWFDDAVREAELADSEPRTPVYEGAWPPSLAVRANIERASFNPLDRVGFVHDDSVPDPTGDRGRLLGHEELVALAKGWVRFGQEANEPPLDSVKETDLIPAGYEAARRVLPRFVASARTWAALGRGERALDVLNRAMEIGLKTARATAAMDLAEREKIAVFRRFRLPAGDLPERHAGRGGARDIGKEYQLLAGVLSDERIERQPPPASDTLEDLDPTAVESTARAALWHLSLVDDHWDGWLRSLPKRLIAELALEEGELMAREDPTAAARLLGFAAHAFRDQGDALGTLFASLLQVSAGARAGVEESALRQLFAEAVKPAFEACRQHFGWTELGASAPRRASDDVWAPWLDRYVAWAARLDPDAGLDWSAAGDLSFRHEYPERHLSSDRAPGELEAFSRSQPGPAPPVRARGAPSGDDASELENSDEEATDDDASSSAFSAFSALSAFSASSSGGGAFRVVQSAAHGRAAPANAVSITAQADGNVRIELDADVSRTWIVPLGPEDVAYRELREQLPADLRAAVEALGAATLSVEVKTPVLARRPWEALAQLGGEAGGAARVFRTRREPALRATDGGIAMLADRRWVSAFSGVLDERVELWSEQHARSETDHAVILLGNVLETTAGAALRVDTRERRVMKAAQTREGGILHPSTSKIFAAPVVVLMNEPVEALASSVSARRHAALLRELAHATAKSAGIVLAVPGLPVELASELLVHVAAFLAQLGTQPDPEAALDLVEAARARIRNHPLESDEQDGRIEAALDLVLYVGNARQEKQPQRSK